jgi:hypothetical protein
MLTQPTTSRREDQLCLLGIMVDGLEQSKHFGLAASEINDSLSPP